MRVEHQHTKTQSSLSRPGDDCRVKRWESSQSICGSWKKKKKQNMKVSRSCVCKLIRGEERDRRKKRGNWRRTRGPGKVADMQRGGVEASERVFEVMEEWEKFLEGERSGTLNVQLVEEKQTKKIVCSCKACPLTSFGKRKFSKN